MENEKISIITICLNCEKEIRKTINSILFLKYTNFEYIIKDGGSQDNTNKIIETYKDDFDKKGIMLLHIIEPDTGIYNAMNQAITYCKGSWINFMNAGDEFFSENVLSDIFNKSYTKEIGVLYGHTCYELSNHLKFISNHNLNEITKGICYCHQSIFVRNELMELYNFNCEYKILADYDMLLKLYFNNIKFFSINTVVSNYSRMGISSYQLDIANKELRNIQLSYGLDDIKMINNLVNKIKTIICRKFPFLSDVIFCYKQMKRIYRYSLEEDR